MMRTLQDFGEAMAGKTLSEAAELILYQLDNAGDETERLLDAVIPVRVAILMRSLLVWAVLMQVEDQ